MSDPAVIMTIRDKVVKSRRAQRTTSVVFALSDPLDTVVVCVSFLKWFLPGMLVEKTLFRMDILR